LTKIKAGDYLFIEFGHNDQKEKGEGKGPYTSYKTNLKTLVTQTRDRGGIPVLVTPIHRRRFDNNGKIINTHGEYPDAVRQLAEEENVALIDLHKMSGTLYEAMGEEQSKRAFVHYPKGTFPGQNADLADNTHFNFYGGYEIAKCILRGIIDGNIPLKKYILPQYKNYNPAQPDDIDAFRYPPTPFFEMEKPDGN
jgi:lysophospholipase L1-like esterase